VIVARGADQCHPFAATIMAAELVVLPFDYFCIR
jgi:hypothetical protein